MPQSKAFALPPSKLNDFLLAEVETQTNGLSLTVLSLLARTGKDPWAEAERLAGLPNETAIAAMTRAIATRASASLQNVIPTLWRLVSSSGFLRMINCQARTRRVSKLLRSFILHLPS